MSVKLGALFGALALVMTGCGQREAEPQVKGEWIYRDSGAIQCESEGMSLTEMRQQLENTGIAVRDASCGSDGIMRTMVCGAPSGQIGLFEVAETELESAAALGFEPLSQLPQATRTPCRDAESPTR